MTTTKKTFFALLVGFFSTATDAHAAPDDTREVASRVAEQWRSAGGKATALPPRFLFDDETILVPVPSSEEHADCIHIAIVGARGLSFHARLSDVSFDPLAPPEAGSRAASLAGVLELSRCGGEHPVRNVVVTSDAGRGTIEMVMARSPGELPSLAHVVPERTGGALPPAPEAGSLPPLPAPEKRADAAEARARREGA
ncbi:MAG TPA: hypothetical protein VIF62_40135, partial [Labilithrix sp.]